MLTRSNRWPVIVVGCLVGILCFLSASRQPCQCPDHQLLENNHAVKTLRDVVNQPPTPPLPDTGMTDPKTEVESLPEELPPCPERSPHLRKQLHKSIQSNIYPGSLELFFSEEFDSPYPPIMDGGVYRPRHCKAKQRVAIIIPYRDRYEHLHIQLQNLYPLLRRQQADFRFFLIEQNLPTTFNQGMLFNIGFIEANKLDNYDCAIFSDVDLLPLNDEALYLCNPDNPIQLTGAISKWKYNLPYDDYYGGIVAFTKAQFEKINGFSNMYFGWGGVDDDLLRRVRNKGFKKVRYAKDVGIFDMIKHERDKGNHVNPERQALLKDCTTRQDVEGLSTTIYTTTKMDIKPLYTWIHVKVNMTQTINTSPKATQLLLKTMSKEATKFDIFMEKRAAAKEEIKSGEKEITKTEDK